VDSIWLWVGFNVFVLAMLALDLGVFHRSAHTVSAKEAAVWSVASGAGRYVLSMLPIF
jgi:tellurite resistance protein TerC